MFLGDLKPDHPPARAMGRRGFFFSKKKKKKKIFPDPCFFFFERRLRDSLPKRPIWNESHAYTSFNFQERGLTTLALYCVGKGSRPLGLERGGKEGEKNEQIVRCVLLVYTSCGKVGKMNLNFSLQTCTYKKSQNAEGRERERGVGGKRRSDEGS